MANTGNSQDSGIERGRRLEETTQKPKNSGMPWDIKGDVVGTVKKNPVNGGGINRPTKPVK